VSDLIEYDAQSDPVEFGKRIETYLMKSEDPQKTWNLTKYIKLLKQHQEIQKNEAMKHEIFWGEIFGYWQFIDLIDGKIKRGKPYNCQNFDNYNWQQFGIDHRYGNLYQRLHNGFTWNELKALKDEIRLPKLNTILNRIPSETILIIPTPEKYPVIYADPPWRYSFAQYADVQLPYETLTVEQIIDYEIDGKSLKEEYFDKNAVLFLWATNPKLVEALRVMEGWGFEYKTNICWDKVKATSSTMGKWLKSRHELLLIGTKGALSPPSPDRKIESVYVEEKTAHSRKPRFFIDLIEGWYQLPGGAKYLELFGRNKTNERWEVLGNQVQ